MYLFSTLIHSFQSECASAVACERPKRHNTESKTSVTKLKHQQMSLIGFAFIISSDRSSYSDSGLERERFISSHDIGCIFSYKLRYFRQTCGAYMVNTDLLPAAPQIGILSSFFLVELPDSKSQLMEQIVLSIMMFCLGGSHQSLKIFCFNLKKVLKSCQKETQHYHQDQVRLKEVSDWHWEQREPSQAFQKETEPSLHHHLNHHLNHHHQNQNLKAKMEAKPPKNDAKPARVQNGAKPPKNDVCINLGHIFHKICHFTWGEHHLSCINFGHIFP